MGMELNESSEEVKLRPAYFSVLLGVGGRKKIVKHAMGRFGAAINLLWDQ